MSHVQVPDAAVRLGSPRTTSLCPGALPSGAPKLERDQSSSIRGPGLRSFARVGGFCELTCAPTPTHLGRPNAGGVSRHPPTPGAHGRWPGNHFKCGGCIALSQVSSPPWCPLLPSRILVRIEAIIPAGHRDQTPPPRTTTTPPNSRPSSSGRDVGCVRGFAPAAAAVCLKNARGVCFHSAPQAASSASAP